MQHVFRLTHTLQYGIVEAAERSAGIGEDREEPTKIDALDLLISVLKEHEKSLNLISASLEEQLNRLTDTVTRLEALRTEATAMKPKKKRLRRREQPLKGRPR